MSTDSARDAQWPERTPPPYARCRLRRRPWIRRGWSSCWPVSGSGSRRRPRARPPTTRARAGAAPLGWPRRSSTGTRTRWRSCRPRGVAQRRRRAAAARPVHGLRLDARRAPQPGGGGEGHRGPRCRHAVRHAQPQRDRRGRALPAALRHGAGARQLRHRGRHVRGESRAAFTGKHGIIKIEGGYHGGYDALSVSVKPDVDEAGPEDAPVPVVPFEVEAGIVHVVPYNNLERLEQVLSEHSDEVAALVMEPVLENLGIVLPDAGTPPRCASCATSTACCSSSTRSRPA